jgi:hypothetical protein
MKIEAILVVAINSVLAAAPKKPKIKLAVESTALTITN